MRWVALHSDGRFLVSERVKVRSNMNILGLSAGEEAELERDDNVEKMLRHGYWVQLVPCQATE